MSAARWPNLFVVGAPKAGTTTLYRHLAAHPDIYMSPLKEPHFFSRVRPAPGREAFYPTITDRAAYLALFEAAREERFRGEASTSYLWDPEAAGRIAEAAPEAWIVICLRDPVERAYSNYWNDVREGLEDRPFLDAIRAELALPERAWGRTTVYLDCSWYAAAVQRYLERFPDRVAIVFFERLADRPRDELRALFARLGLDASIADRMETRRENPFALPRGRLAARLLGSARFRRVARRILPRRARPAAKERLLRSAPKPAMAPAARALLEDLYEADSRALAESIGPLPWWPRPPRAA